MQPKPIKLKPPKPDMSKPVTTYYFQCGAVRSKPFLCDKDTALAFGKQYLPMFRLRKLALWH